MLLTPREHCVRGGEDKRATNGGMGKHEERRNKTEHILCSRVIAETVGLCQPANHAEKACCVGYRTGHAWSRRRDEHEDPCHQLREMGVGEVAGRHWKEVARYESTAAVRRHASEGIHD